MEDVLSQGMHAVIVHGIEQRYHVVGNGPVCVVHPGGPGAEWSYMQMPLLERHFTMLYVEPIGTGLSGRLPEHPGGYGVARYSEQLGGLLEALDLHNVILLGHSYGGFVIQHYALTHPERIAGLVLYATSGVAGGELMAAAGEGVDAFVSRHAGLPIADEVATAWRSMPTLRTDAECTKAFRAILPVYFADYENPDSGFSDLHPKIAASLITGDGVPFDVRTTLPGLEKPVLIIAGDQDFICGSRWAVILHDVIPQSRLVIVDDCGHFIHVEKPTAFDDAVVNFAEEGLASET